MGRSGTINDRNKKNFKSTNHIFEFFPHDKKLRLLSHGDFKIESKSWVTIFYLPICPIASFPGGEMKISSLPLPHHEEK